MRRFGVLYAVVFGVVVAFSSSSSFAQTVSCSMVCSQMGGFQGQCEDWKAKNCKKKKKKKKERKS